MNWKRIAETETEPGNISVADEILEAVNSLLESVNLSIKIDWADDKETDDDIGIVKLYKAEV